MKYFLSAFHLQSEIEMHVCCWSVKPELLLIAQRGLGGVFVKLVSNHVELPDSLFCPKILCSTSNFSSQRDPFLYLFLYSLLLSFLTLFLLILFSILSRWYLVISLRLKGRHHFLPADKYFHNTIQFRLEEGKLLAIVLKMIPPPPPLNL